MLLDGPEVSQNLHELQEVDTIVVAASEESMHDPVPQRVDGQFRDAEEVLAGERASVSTIQ